MADVYGIDLGTTYSAIAKLNNVGYPEVITDNDLGKDILASAVYFTEDGETIVGDDAKEAGVSEPDRLKQFFKRWIGRGTDPNREHYIVDGKEYDPIELSAIVLGRIIKYANDNGEDVKDVVITCPAYFDYAQRDATKQAGIAAGLNVMCVVNEPTAAAINYCADKFNEDKIALVYDLGGGTFDVTIVKMSEKDGNREVDVLGTDGNAFLGGCDWDNALYGILSRKYEEKYGLEVSSELESMLRGEVEKAKTKLTTKDSTKVKVNYEGESIALEVTREEFESETADLVDQTIGWLNSVLSKANCTDDDIDVVLMVGGSTRMPMIRNMLSARYGDRVEFSEPDKAVAKGAAYVASMKQKDEYSKMLESIQQQIEKGEVEVVSTGDGFEVKDLVTGETIDDLTDDLNNAVDLNIIAEPEQVIGDDGVIADVTLISPGSHNSGIVVTDVAPRSFGIIAAMRNDDGSIAFICDTIVKKDEKVPCKYERTYYTPEDNVERLRFPVVESITLNDMDPVDYDRVVKDFTFPDPALDMKLRNQLVLPVPAGLPMDTEIFVEFSLDELGNVKLKATENTTGASEEIEFSFNEASQELLQQITENQKNRVYAVGE